MKLEQELDLIAAGLDSKWHLHQASVVRRAAKILRGIEVMSVMSKIYAIERGMGDVLIAHIVRSHAGRIGNALAERGMIAVTQREVPADAPLKDLVVTSTAYVVPPKLVKLTKE